MLIRELEGSGGELRLETEIYEVKRDADAFVVQTSVGPINAESVVVATGGLSIPKIGATGFAYELAAWVMTDAGRSSVGVHDTRHSKGGTASD